MTIKIYENDQIYVRPLIKSDITERYIQWFYDQEVCKYNSHGLFARPYNDEKIKDSIFKLDPEKHLVWAVMAKNKGEYKYPTYSDLHIGNCVLNINWINRNAEFTCIFGEKEYWGNGYCTQVLKWMIDHAFSKLNIHKVWLGTAQLNIGMIKAAENNRMSCEAELQDEVYLNGMFLNVKRMSIFND